MLDIDYSYSLNWAEIVKDKETGKLWIKCNDCWLVSYNPIDIEEKFCPNCNNFHDLSQIKLSDSVKIEELSDEIAWILVVELE